MSFIIPWWILPLLSLLTIPLIISRWIGYSRVLVALGKDDSEARNYLFSQLLSMRLLPAALSMAIGAMFAFPHGAPSDRILHISTIGIIISMPWAALALWLNSGVDIDSKIESGEDDAVQEQQKIDQPVTIRMKPGRYYTLVLYVLEFVGYLIGRTFYAT